MQTAIMDSSPQPAPVRRPLKRSASTASLPTPPYTREHRKRRAGDRDNEDELDDSASDAGQDEEDEILKAKADRKGTGMLASAKPKPVAPSREPSKKRLKIDHEDVSQESKDTQPAATSTPEETKPAPLSPPRSRRQTRSCVVSPRTPPPRKAKKTASKPMPVRGSPDNPFLEDESAAGGSKDIRPPPRRDSEEYEEKPTVAWVFRGVKATFENPLYKLSPTTRAKAKLPMEDPNFSPDPAVPPRRLLFNNIDEDEEAILNPKPKRLFTSVTSVKPKAAKPAAKPKAAVAKSKAAAAKPKAC